MKTLMIASLVSLGVIASPVMAGDAAAGKAKAVICAACHGPDGKAAIPTYPNLKGQNEGYIKLAIKAYQSGARSGGQADIMAGIAKSLSDADVDNVAAYFSSL